MPLLPGNQNCAWKEAVNDWLISLHFHAALKIIPFVNLITVSRWRGRILSSQGEEGRTEMRKEIRHFNYNLKLKPRY